ncbi:MAG: hypothetical protein KJ063_12945 [Anaerolineae bacterium]|nr:hypothetical protein [Anaerolineae bacterium]
MGFLEKLTLNPETVGPTDVEPMRQAGVTDAAIEEAIQVCFCFNVITRLADAFAFDMPTAEGFKKSGEMLYKMGYGTSSIPG